VRCRPTAPGPARRSRVRRATGLRANAVFRGRSWPVAGAARRTSASDRSGVPDALRPAG